MCKNLTFLISLVLVLIMVNGASAELVGHWRFDGNLDDSVGAANGTFNGGSPLYVTGRIGQGIEFDGVNDFAHLPSANPSAYTITLWVRPARTNAASVIARTSNLGPTTHWSHQLRINPQGVFHHYLWVGSERNLAGTTLVEADTWYHVAIAAANNGPMQLYVNGEEDAPSIGVAGTLWGEGDRYYVGSNSGHGMGWFQGVVDDVQIYDTILTAEEIGRIAASSGGFPLAFGPNPKDGALHADTWVTLSWKAGDFAVSHDVYLGDNFADVNGGTHESGTFRGNQALTYYVAGFPGFAYPDGLVPGTTYYWRIDEVNTAHPDSPWKGPVWRFSIPSKKARDPVPADGSKFIDVAAVTLSWTAGFGAKLHTVYFGDNRDTIANAVGGVPQGTTTYKPGVLEAAKTYYWRVDEFNTDGTTSKGSLWSFSTGAFLVVDDFETYNDIDPPSAASNRIFDKWIDGFTTPTTNGALVGDNLPPYTEPTIVHGGSQSMPYAYDNANKTSEATLTLVWPRNWTEENVTKLSLWFRGDPANAAEKMYVSLNGGTPVYHADSKAAQSVTWTEWVINLSVFQGATLNNVNTITIGFGTKGSPSAGGTGKVYFDDIRLIR